MVFCFYFNTSKHIFFYDNVLVSKDCNRLKNLRGKKLLLKKRFLQFYRKQMGPIQKMKRQKVKRQKMAITWHLSRLKVFKMVASAQKVVPSINF